MITAPEDVIFIHRSQAPTGMRIDAVRGRIRRRPNRSRPSPSNSITRSGAESETSIVGTFSRLLEMPRVYKKRRRGRRKERAKARGTTAYHHHDAWKRALKKSSLDGQGSGPRQHLLVYFVKTARCRGGIDANSYEWYQDGIQEHDVHIWWSGTRPAPPNRHKPGLCALFTPPQEKLVTTAPRRRKICKATAKRPSVSRRDRPAVRKRPPRKRRRRNVRRSMVAFSKEVWRKGRSDSWVKEPPRQCRGDETGRKVPPYLRATHRIISHRKCLARGQAEGAPSVSLFAKYTNAQLELRSIAQQRDFSAQPFKMKQITVQARMSPSDAVDQFRDPGI
eukprot:CAMPEP_0178983570 /NCGR_PEP_ID=MMETSP0795-20121207/1132_1 /TAXON_ID=88552 /ORGANISM="Amoebophrya sp., Strain Ameob2" /LENGTH=334 /DNA_ID=CAMNT_0020674355 /DNA_START=511 /DNA_END=1512 /DNA_ORIENTATION=-